jgi:hypothetical protein
MGGVPHPTYFYSVTLLVVLLHSKVEFKIVETHMRDLRGKVTELKSFRGHAPPPFFLWFSSSGCQ